jgi:cytidylate kinase
MIVLGIVGHMGAGKTTVAKFLEEELQFTSLSFADCVRDVLDMLHLEHTRSNMQGVGATLRAWNKDVWINSMMHAVASWGRSKEYYDKHGYDFGSDWVGNQGAEKKRFEQFVFSDVRYHNEAEYVRSLGGVLIGLWASYEDLYERIKARDNIESMGEFITQMGHESEGHIDELLKECNIRIDTSAGEKGTLAVVEAFVQRVIRERETHD